MKAGLIQDPTAEAMGQFMTRLSKRQQLVASNIANIDTPGYKTKDVSFHATMEEILSGGLAAAEHEHSLRLDSSRGGLRRMEPEVFEVRRPAGAGRPQQRRHRPGNAETRRNVLRLLDDHPVAADEIPNDCQQHQRREGRLMSLMTAIEVSASGLSAQRRRLEVLMSNLVNANTTQPAGDEPYRRKDVVFTAAAPQQSFGSAFGRGDECRPGGRDSQVVTDQADPIKRYEPGHPHADKDGYVCIPMSTRWRRWSTSFRPRDPMRPTCRR